MTPPLLISAMRGSSRNLNSDYLPHELLLVEVVDGVLGILHVVEIDKGILVLDGDVLDFSVFPEEILQVIIPTSVSDPTDVNARSHIHTTKSLVEVNQAI